MRFLGTIKHDDINEKNCCPLERYNLLFQRICSAVRFDVLKAVTTNIIPHSL